MQAWNRYNRDSYDRMWLHFKLILVLAKKYEWNKRKNNILGIWNIHEKQENINMYFIGYFCFFILPELYWSCNWKNKIGILLDEGFVTCNQNC